MAVVLNAQYISLHTSRYRTNLLLLKLDTLGQKVSTEIFFPLSWSFQDECQRLVHVTVV